MKFCLYVCLLAAMLLSVTALTNPAFAQKGATPVYITNNGATSSTAVPVSGTVGISGTPTVNATISGTPNVNIANSPTVAISSMPSVNVGSMPDVNVGNTVSTVSAEQYYSDTHTWTLSDGWPGLQAALFPTKNVLVESASVECKVPVGQRIDVSVITAADLLHQFPHPIPLQYQGTYSNQDRYSATVPLKAFHKTVISDIQTLAMGVNFDRSDSAGAASCTATLDGTLKP